MLELQQESALETKKLALGLLESLELSTEDLVQQQVSNSQRVSLEVSETLTLTGSGFTRSGQWN